MAKGNGKDRSTDLLENVVTELRGLREDSNAQIGGLRQEMQKQLGGLRQEMREGFAQAHARFERLDEKVGRVETVLVDTRQELRGLKGEIQGLKGEVHEGFAELGAKIESAAQRDRSLEKEVRELGQRVARLEARSEPE